MIIITLIIIVVIVGGPAPGSRSTAEPRGR